MRRKHVNRPELHLGSRQVLPALGLILAACSLFAPSAFAASGPFCPGSSGSMALAGGARCVWVYHNQIAEVGFNNILTPVRKCAVVKPNSDGSGGNVGGRVDCTPGQVIAYVSFPAWGVSGYAVGINQSSNYHTGFKGYLTLY